MAIACITKKEAEKRLEEWRMQHQQATHLCYAYRLGSEGKIYRANDDGEPSNSAGAPIFGQIQSYDITNVLIGVVRYYGGTKLGVGGLINAYRTAAKDAIENGKIVEKLIKDYAVLTFSYSDMPFVMAMVKKNQIEILEQKFEAYCYLKICCAINSTKEISEKLLKFETLKIEKIETF